MHPVFGNSPIPRYVQLADVLRQRIARGQWRSGDRLPSTDELAREFDVARVTVRQAIDVLARDAWVKAQQGRGTFVTDKAARDRRLHTVTTIGDLSELYTRAAPEFTNLEESSASPPLEPADGKAARRYFHMRRVHAFDGTPHCALSLYIDDRVFRRAPDAMRRQLVIPLLMSMPGVKIADVRQTLTIGSADVDEARLVGIPVNAPVARVRRVITAPDGVVIYLAEATYRGDFVLVEMHMKR
jgi:GntR family transcriptional regulator